MDEIRLLPINKAGYEAISMALDDWAFSILLDDNLPKWEELPELPADAPPEAEGTNVCPKCKSQNLDYVPSSADYLEHRKKYGDLYKCNDCNDLFYIEVDKIKDGGK